LFCVSSIPAAKKYYVEFLKQQKSKPDSEKIRVTTIFSFTQNENDTDLSTNDEDMDLNRLDKSSREFLESVMNDYKNLFSDAPSFSTDGEGFQNYYKDISKRMKNKEIDLLIVVNMFLTGFDATTLNTL
jgi:type I restriction enzyme R subunit